VHKENSLSSSRRRVLEEDNLTVTEYSRNLGKKCLSISCQEGTYIPSRNKGSETFEVRAVEAQGETNFLNTLEEDLCKECTRKTLIRSVERQPF
jgi:hypothetical protein